MKTQKILLKRIIAEIKRDKQIIAVLLYSSYLKNKPYARDIDICLVLDKKYDSLEMGRKRLKYLSMAPSKYDIQIFQQLPLYVRKSVLGANKILLCKNEDLLYEIAYMTIKEFGMYEKVYRYYIDGIKK